MRPAGNHLTGDEIDFLLSSKEAAAASGSGKNRQEFELHIVECEHCRVLLRMHQAAQDSLSNLKNAGTISRGKDCPNETVWTDSVTFVLNKEEISRYAEHAAACDYCGRQLYEALTDFVQPLTAEENELLSRTQLSHPLWQREMVEKMTAKASGSFKPPAYKKPAFWRYKWSLAAASLILVTAGISLLWWQSSNRNAKPPEDLLAEAYKDRRTLELRVGAARHARIHQDRGAGEKSFIDRPQALMDAEAIISRGLKSHPDNAAWLQAKGRADLLAWNYDAAIKSLRRALEANPGSADLQIDLASAYFERAEATEQSLDYGTSLELLGKALASQPDNVIALFNRAVIAERLRLYEQAAGDWEHYLRLEHDPEWAAEGHEHLDNIRKKKVSTR